MSRGRLFWLVTLPKSAAVGSVPGLLKTGWLNAFRNSTLNCARTPSVDRHLLHDRDVPQVQPLAAQARYPRREVPDVVRQPDARVGALLRRIVDAVGLDRGVVEVEAADVEHRLVGIARVVALQRAQVAVEVDVAIVEADRPSALELADAPAGSSRRSARWLSPEAPLAHRRPLPNGSSQMPLSATRCGTSNSDSRSS